MHDVRVSVVQECHGIKGSSGGSSDGVDILTVTFTLTLESFSVWDTTRVVSTRSSHARVRAVVHIDAGKGLCQNM